jgi:hypothetical protein
MTRMAGFPQGIGLRGDDSHGKLTPRGENGDDMQSMSMGGMQGMHMASAEKSGDSAIPSAALGAGKQATAPDGPLANTQLDAGMMGIMSEQMKKGPKLSAEQQRNLDAFDMGENSMKAQEIETSPNANNVPNFPQDAYMEGPMMNMERLVDKPENLGLRPNWSRFMQGMMTFIRVLPPDQYDQVVAAMRDAKRPNDPYASIYTTGTDRTRS